MVRDVAFVVYNGMTALDFVGVYDPVTRLKTMAFVPDVTWEICALTEEVKDHSGLCLVPTRVGQSLRGYDLVVVPGGYASRELVDELEFVDWLQSAAPCKLKAAVCTGALLLGAAGFLKQKKATTHPSAFDLLRPFCAAVVDERVVDEGDVITAGGVTAAIDLGLAICSKVGGREVEERIRRQMDYWPARAVDEIVHRC